MFPSLNIPTRILGGQVDIIDKIHLVVKGEKVGKSEAVLLTKLGIKPFYYGILVSFVRTEVKSPKNKNEKKQKKSVIKKCVPSPRALRNCRMKLFYVS